MNNRRRFLRTTLYTAVSTLFIPRLLRAAGDPTVGACTITTADIEGPYFASGAPFRVVLAAPNEPGTRLFMSGRVLARDCSPIPGATVDIWAANNDGCYSWFNDCPGAPGDDRFNLRGRILTNAEGAYAYETVKPGPYSGRPSHIHYKITQPDGSGLTTQLYFEGDPLIPADPWAGQASAALRIIPLRSEADGLHGTLDIILDVDAVATVEPADPDAENVGFSLEECEPNPFRESTTIRYSLLAPAHVDVVVFSMLGGRVRTLSSGISQPGEHRVGWDGRDEAGRRAPAGTYLVWTQAGGEIRVKQVTRR
jgi:catechol 1,2-dioxygenase